MYIQDKKLEPTPTEYANTSVFHPSMIIIRNVMCLTCATLGVSNLLRLNPSK